MGHLLNIARQTQPVPDDLLEPGLRDLIERVAAYFNATADELVVILEIAARDPRAAQESFEDSARRGWLV